jgi:heptosyltransferase-2
MHLSAALGLPGVAVFGPTDYRATGPVSDKWLLVNDKEPCAPCFKRVCPSGTRNCMKKLSPEEVIKALHQLNVM